MIDIREPQTAEEFARYYTLRWRVLREPWGRPIGSEKDQYEDRAIHLMACQGDTVVGVARAHFSAPGEGMIRYMAVEEAYRGQGIGGALLCELERRLRAQNARCIVLNAREMAVGFYENYGYEIVAKAHTLYGCIEHFRMSKQLTMF
ncbi:MAG TPA: GNAT family N-acetyltransferase [Anaerohalosphaeraceae bacterium]|jgi:ribosomal protein S18 acetylase RimI-like enzyme|nr:GNAT family N-acetyltransferase [Anaerohalosphaeraceae bacterium]HRT50746.1 GNAT family N-acetyltransferase [Anaerohalosphaeraceae bacterium]HRT86901.1 GNAT family N-acetyltransferase [Anaerohalosphaeraceae bacterium]